MLISNSVSPLCRLCREREEAISHVVAECKMLAQKQYCLWWHDKAGVIAHWVMCKRYMFSIAANWYEYTPEKVLENDNVKILWDFPAQTNCKINKINSLRKDLSCLDWWIKDELFNEATKGNWFKVKDGDRK